MGHYRRLLCEKLHWLQQKGARINEKSQESTLGTGFSGSFLAQSGGRLVDCLANGASSLSATGIPFKDEYGHYSIGLSTYFASRQSPFSVFENQKAVETVRSRYSLSLSFRTTRMYL
jgi:hypothetical protein